MSASHSAVICRDLQVEWPDGTVVLDGCDLSFSPGRTGLIGPNGCGKSTLLQLIAGQLTPGRGEVRCSGSLAYLPQDITGAGGATVADLLGVGGVVPALERIEAGCGRPDDFATIGTDWQLPTLMRAELERLGLEQIGFDRTVSQLSGGETVLIALAGRLARRPDILLLDEPTNNLDRPARRRLLEVVQAFRGTMVVVSHDPELLECVDRIVDLGRRDVRVYGGNFSDYTVQVAAEKETAERLLRAAEGQERRQARELAEAQTTLARRVRYGNKMWEQKREPKIVMAARKRQAQVSAGKYRGVLEDRLSGSREALRVAEQAARDDDQIRITLPQTAVPSGQVMLRLVGGERPLELVGPGRVAVVGPNGAGKTTLLRSVLGDAGPAGGPGPATRLLDVRGPIGYLPQRPATGPADHTVLAAAQAALPGLTPHQVRAGLARFLLRGRQLALGVGTLSGGELFRLKLACLLLADPAPRLLLLDEPTNNLDLPSRRQLVTALSAYGGAMLIASHDRAFLDEIGITQWWRVDRDQGVRLWHSAI